MPAFSYMKALIFLNLLFSLFFSIPTLAKEDVTEIPEKIKQIFPTATRVGAQESDIPVIPVYQLQKFLGYAFESKHFANFIGFSGKPINLLIGIDEKGQFIDVLVLSHAEPIFLHGLGEQSLFEFVAQYKGNNVKQRFIIGGNKASGVDANYFDGVTKATVSVLVINDTIITSALKVARSKLNGFAPLSNKMLKPDYFEPLRFSQLLERGLITEHTIYQSDFDNLPSEIVRAGAQYLDENQVFSQHYYLFLNIPIVGKNILGEEEFARLQKELKPGEFALLVINTKAHSFLSEEFIPQTYPENFRMSQGELPLPAKDLDFYSFDSPQFVADLPEYKSIKVLKLKSQSGMDLSQEISLSIALTYSPSFMERDEHLFTFDLSLPGELFMINPDAIVVTKEALWVTLWKSRIFEISVVCVYLVLLLYFFVFQSKFVKHTKLVHRTRLASLFFILFFIGFYAQGQLSVVNIYTLLLSIWDGFQIEVFLLDPVIFILWVFVFISLFLFGRGLYCGWLCPFGALQEMMGWLATKLRIKQIKINDEHHRFGLTIKYFILIGIVASAFYSFTLAEVLSEVEPFKTSITLYFVRYWPFALYAVALLLLSMKVHKVYCRYLCPLGAGLAVLGRFPIFKLLRRRSECGSPCQLCRQRKCGIDAINKDGSIDYAECIQCLECVVTLDNPNLCKIDKYKKKAIETPVQVFHPN